MSEGPRLPALGDPSNPLEGKTIVLGVTGGIAAYKAAELTRLLTDAGARVRVVMTRAAQEFIGKLTLQTLSGQPVATELFDLTQESEIGHIKLADDADLVVIAPATADVIGRMAAGLADDLLTTVVLATRARVLLAPAMNVNMWAHPLVERNVATLVATGRVLVVGPGAGFLACGWTGPGRMVEPAAIVEASRRALTAQDLAGRRLLITAGPTHEAIDPVRWIGNHSSGKMGFAIAEAAAQRGAEVTLVAGPVALPTPLGVTRIDVVEARAMHREVMAREATAEVVIKAAAVADYRVGERADRKLSKDGSGALHLDLTANPDILAELGQARRARGGQRPLLVGFAAETPASVDELIAKARAKLANKGCDLVVANDVSASGVGFGGDESALTIVGPQTVDPLGAGRKRALAHRLLDRIVRALGGDAG